MSGKVVTLITVLTVLNVGVLVLYLCSSTTHHKRCYCGILLFIYSPTNVMVVFQEELRNMASTAIRGVLSILTVIITPKGTCGRGQRTLLLKAIVLHSQQLPRQCTNTERSVDFH
jgi:hypothetical protein